MQLSVLLAGSDILKFGASCRRKRQNVTLLDARFLMVSFAVCVTLPLLPRAEVHFDGANLRVLAQLYLLRAEIDSRARAASQKFAYAHTHEFGS